MKLTITGYSTAMFATWYFVEELGLLFDAGDGLTASLLGKARKVDHVFISHADRDHLTGLLQFNQLNARKDFPKIFFPKHCGSFPKLEEFSKKFDPHVTGTIWNPIQDNDLIRIKDDFYVQPIRNSHVPAEPEISKSFGYQVYQVKQKLKPEYATLGPDQIKQLVQEIGREKMTEQIRTNVLTYSGDTPVDDYEKWNNTKILIHEATFLENDEPNNLNTHKHKHSYLEEVLKMVSGLSIETLILGHFSSRYSQEEIDARIKLLCKKLNLKIPVYRLLPGQVHRDILNETPLNN